MVERINDIVDICLKRVKAGETIEDCMRDYPEHRTELEMLLSTARRLYSVPIPSVTNEFRQESRIKVLARLREGSSPKPKIQGKLHVKSIFRRLTLSPFTPLVMIVLITMSLWFALSGEVPEKPDAAKFTVSILRGQVEIKQNESTSWETAVDGTEFVIGTCVRTSPASHAVITFFDGSTIKLDPGTEIQVVESAFISGKSVHIAIDQISGKTWNYVIGAAEEFPYYSVKTPSSTLIAQGTSFSVEIIEDFGTQLVVSEGTVKVIDAQNTQVTVANDHEIRLDEGLATASLASAAGSKNELILTSDSASVSSVRDPSGASTGCLPNGISFNQIPNSKSTLSVTEQVIRVEEPVEGEYIIVVRPLTKTETSLDIKLLRNGDIFVNNTIVLPAARGEGWIVHLNIETTISVAKSGDKITIEPLTGKTPESLVETPLARKRAVPIRLVPKIDNVESDNTSETGETGTIAPSQNTPNTSTTIQEPSTESPETTKPSESGINTDQIPSTTLPQTSTNSSTAPPTPTDSDKESTRITP
jgi:hypothetical protein